ncbi:MAG TPA: methyltransferase domain-containing protein [Kofleriaceae bacterium]|nr:methyltransferase domain-containing protein [Kofleriaceae bacterium]
MGESTPERVRSEQAADFAKDHLQGRPRVLHVGRPSSLVPGQLSNVGFDVTCSTDDMLATLENTFDAIVFSHALSAAPSLESTIAHAAALLAPTGRLIVDDLDSQAIDTTSVRWYYDTQELLHVAGVFPAERVHPVHADPIVRWREGVRREGILHTGTEMRIAISARFAIRELKRVEGYYRHVSDGLSDDALGAAIATHVRTTERRLITTDNMLPVGLRIVADRAR